MSDEASAAVARAAENATAQLIEAGDLDRLVALARVIGGAEDALSDEMVGRLAGVAADGIDLLDKVNRSGVARALPAIAALIENGDLDRIVSLARVFGGMEDALSDDMIGRLANIASETVSIIDRLHRDGLSSRLLRLLAEFEASGLAPKLIGAIDKARAEVASGPAPQGGFGGLISLMKRKDTQEAMQFGLALLNALRTG